MRFLILAHLGDETALRVCAALRRRHGPEHVRLVSSEELVLAPYWSHRLDDGCVTTRLRLWDGTVLDSDGVEVVFNRLLALPVPQFSAASEVDRDYAGAEMHALCLSWLSSLRCPVVNPAMPPGLGAPVRSQAEWLWLAAMAGLPVQAYHFTTDPRWSREPANRLSPWQPVPGFGAASLGESVAASQLRREPTLYLETLEEPASIVVAGTRVVGHRYRSHADAFRRLARTAGCDLMEVVVGRPPDGGGGRAGDDNWKVHAVTPFPRTAGAEAVAAIVELLELKCPESRRGAPAPR